MKNIILGIMIVLLFIVACSSNTDMQTQNSVEEPEIESTNENQEPEIIEEQEADIPDETQENDTIKELKTDEDSMNEIVDTSKVSITVIATEDSMKAGYIDVTFEGYANNQSIIMLDAGSGFIDISNVIEPYNENGDYTIIDSMNILYTFNEEDTVHYGYRIKSFNDLNVTYIAEDLVWSPVNSLISQRILDYYSQVEIEFDIPDSMYFFAPWLNVSEKQYVLELMDSRFQSMNIQKGGIVAWGKFDDIETYKSNYHSLDVLTYGGSGSVIKDMSIASYKKFIDLLGEDVQKIVMPKMAFVFLGQQLNTRGEGMTGVQVEYTLEDEWPQVTTIREPSNKYPGDGEFNTTNINLKSYGRYAIHQITHAFYDFLPYWWLVEGYADYNLYAWYDVYGIEDDKITKDELMGIYLYYRDNIVKKGYDLPLCLHDGTLDVAKNKYNIIPSDKADELLEIGVSYNSNWEEASDSYFAYTKGALVCHTIDLICKKYTDDKTVDDYMKELILMHHATDHDLSSQEILVEALNRTLGKDSSDFFSRYIFDNEPLPLEVVEGELLVTW